MDRGVVGLAVAGQFGAEMDGVGGRSTARRWVGGLGLLLRPDAAAAELVLSHLDGFVRNPALQRGQQRPAGFLLTCAGWPLAHLRPYEKIYIFN